MSLRASACNARDKPRTKAAVLLMLKDYCGDTRIQPFRGSLAHGPSPLPRPHNTIGKSLSTASQYNYTCPTA